MMDSPILKLFISRWIAVLSGSYPEVVTTKVVPLSPGPPALPLWKV